MKRHLLAFAAAFLATLVFHQPVLWLLGLLAGGGRPVFVMTPVPPFGVPSVISLAFWGGVWGVLMIPVITRTKRYWLAAAVFGASLPTLVALVVVAPLKGAAVSGSDSGKLILGGLIINAAWGLGTALFYRAFSGRTITTSV